MMIDPRTHSLNILNQFFQSKKSLAVIVSKYFSDHQLSNSERNRIFVLTRETIRWKGRLDYWIETVLDNPLKKLDTQTKVLLRCSVYELMLDHSVPDYAAINSWVEVARHKIGEKITGLINAVLRGLTRTNNPALFPDKNNLESTGTWLSHPDWLVEKWKKSFGWKKTKDLCLYNNQNPKGTIRFNPNKTSIKKALDTLDHDGIELTPIEGTDRFFRIQSGYMKLKQHELFLGGSFSIQDRAAGAVVEILDPQPGETILDVCAAPGTKALYCAELMKETGKIYASDIDPGRAEKGRRDFKRHRMEIIEWGVRDAARDEFPLADGILVDAPCTGTGVLAKKPDIRWRRVSKDVQEMKNLQLLILNKISKYLKPAGRLVYSTCSLEPEENWQVVEAFLKLNPSFSLRNIKDVLPFEWIKRDTFMETFPPSDSVDGMFAVCLGKN